MSDPRTDDSSAGSGSRPRLEQAPGERYAARAGARAAEAPDGSAGRDRRRRGIVRALLAADAVALAGALVFFGLGLVDIGAGTVAAAAAVGWAVALALIWGGDGAGLPGRGTRVLVAGGLAASAILLGLVVGWAWARTEGGVLPLLDYLDQRHGPLAWINVAVAAAAGAWRAR